MSEKAFYGICELCGKRTTKAGMTRHLKSCPARQEKPGKRSKELLIHLRVEGRYAPLYWLDLEVSAKAGLSELDAFLRYIWLECCGHLSAFRIGDVDYNVAPDPFEGFFSRRVNRSMETGIGRALAHVNGRPFYYEYDFGSTSELKLLRRGERMGSLGSGPLRLMARNEAPEWPCSACGQPAGLICPECMYGDDPFLCAEHAETHGCRVEAEEMLPVVNSPRMGVCGYCG